MKLAALLLLAGCSASPTPMQQADVAAYAADQQLCITNATTRAQADACRDAVKRIWCDPDGGPLAAAGACVTVRTSTGGNP